MSCAVPGQREEREIFLRRWKLERMGLWLVNPVGEALAYYSTTGVQFHAINAPHYPLGAIKRSRVCLVRLWLRQQLLWRNKRSLTEHFGEQ
jgi:hypothetical protein